MCELPHITNRKIAIAMFVAFLAIMYFMTSCTASKITRNNKQTGAFSELNKAEKEDKKSTLFDLTKITEADYSLKLIPIDPTKAIGQATDPDTGAKTWKNAIPVYETKTKQTNRNVTEQKHENKDVKTTETGKATTTETTKDKLKISVPWYAFLILGFFAFATIIGLYFVYRLSKNFSAITGTLAALEGRLNILEK